jgi:hypothetical protein
MVNKKPITTLLNKEAFSWIEEETKYVEKLKDTMCATPVVATLEFTKIFIVQCDDFGHGIGRFLMQ